MIFEGRGVSIISLTQSFPSVTPGILQSSVHFRRRIWRFRRIELIARPNCRFQSAKSGASLHGPPSTGGALAAIGTAAGTRRQQRPGIASLFIKHPTPTRADRSRAKRAAAVAGTGRPPFALTFLWKIIHCLLWFKPQTPLCTRVTVWEPRRSLAKSCQTAPLLSSAFPFLPGFPQTPHHHHQKAKRGGGGKESTPLKSSDARRPMSWFDLTQAERRGFTHTQSDEIYRKGRQVAGHIEWKRCSKAAGGSQAGQSWRREPALGTKGKTGSAETRRVLQASSRSKDLFPRLSHDQAVWVLLPHVWYPELDQPAGRSWNATVDNDEDVLNWTLTVSERVIEIYNPGQGMIIWLARTRICQPDPGTLVAPWLFSSNFIFSDFCGILWVLMKVP